MKIISYNLNGLRAASKLNVLNWLKDENADIICLQEVRAEQSICEKILKENATERLSECNCEITYIFTNGDVAVCPYMVFVCENEKFQHKREDFFD